MKLLIHYQPSTKQLLKFVNEYIIQYRILLEVRLPMYAGIRLRIRTACIGLQCASWWDHSTWMATFIFWNLEFKRYRNVQEGKQLLSHIVHKIHFPTVPNFIRFAKHKCKTYSTMQCKWMSIKYISKNTRSPIHQSKWMLLHVNTLPFQMLTLQAIRYIFSNYNIYIYWLRPGVWYVSFLNEQFFDVNYSLQHKIKICPPWVVHSGLYCRGGILQLSGNHREMLLSADGFPKQLAISYHLEQI